MAQELTFNITEDRRKLLGPIEAKDFNLKFDRDGQTMSYVDPKNWVQGRIGDESLKQVFVNITEGKKNIPKDVTGMFLRFCGLIYDKDGKPHIVIAQHGSVNVDPQNGRLRFDFPKQAFTVAGAYQQAFFQLIKAGTGECVATLEFDMEVMANFVFSAIVPEDWVEPFNDTLNQLLASSKDYQNTMTKEMEAYKQNISDLYNTWKNKVDKDLADFEDATKGDLAAFKVANANDIATFKQQYADAVKAKQAELQNKVDSYTDKLDTLLKDLNQQGIDTTTMLTDLRSQMAALQDKIKSEHLFTEDEAKELESRIELKLSMEVEHTYDTLDDMLSDQSLSVGMHARTAGYYAINDGGGASYQIVSKETSDYSEKLNNDLYAQLLYGNEPVNILTFGVKGDGNQDCSEIINTVTKNHSIFLPAGEYLVNDQINLVHNLKGEVGPAGMSKDEKGLTTLTSHINSDNAKSVICNHGESTIIEKLNIHINTNENGITDNGKYVTRINDIYVDGIKNACGIKIDRPGSRASVINNVFVNGDGNHQSTGLYYLTGTDELLSNFWSMGCMNGIFAVCCLFYATNIHVWCGSNNKDFYEGSRGTELHRSKAFFTNLYADTTRFAISSDGNSYVSVNNFIVLYDDSINKLMPELSWDGFFNVKSSDYVEVTGGYTFVPKFPANYSLLDPAHVRISKLLITVPEEDKAEDYLTEYYRNYLPNMVMGYETSYRLEEDGKDGKYVEIARIPIGENMFGQVVLQISDAHINNCRLTVELNNGDYSLVDTGGNHYQDLSYKIINNWFVVFAKQIGKYNSNQINAIQLGGLGPVNYNYIRVAGEKVFPRLEQDDDKGLTHITVGAHTQPTTKADEQNEQIKMQNFDLDHDSITGKVGDKLKVTINNIKPDNVTNGNITATSQDPSIVTVTPELNSLVVDVDLLKTGNTTITFKSNDGAVTKLINVVVKS